MTRICNDFNNHFQAQVKSRIYKVNFLIFSKVLSTYYEITVIQQINNTKDNIMTKKLKN